MGNVLHQASNHMAAAKSDKCEYRIFFPLPAEGSEQFKPDDAARPFSLFDAEHFHLFQPTHSTPVAPSAKQVEQRDDIYLLMQDMTNYGLKLRGADASADGGDHASRGASEAIYQLELKLMQGKSGHQVSAGEAAAEVLEGRENLHALQAPEEWKKVVRATRIQSTFANLPRNILPVIQNALAAAKASDKTKRIKMLQALVGVLEAARDDPKQTSPFNVVTVSKRRATIPQYFAEQTDVEVAVVDSAASAAAAAGSSSAIPTRRFRSICFEGPKEQLQSPLIRALFQHLLHRYGDARTKEAHVAAEAAVAAAPASSAASSAAAASSSATPAFSLSGALVAGYPEFLGRAAVEFPKKSE